MNKVLLINGSAPPLRCGVGFYGEKLIEKLSNSLEVDLLTTKKLGINMPGASEIYRLANWKIRQLPKMLSFIKSSNPDFVHIQYHAKGYGRDLGINLLPLFMKVSLPKKPLLLTLHEHHETRMIGKTRNIITAIFVNKIIISNNYDLDALPWFLRKKCIIIPIGSNLLPSSIKQGEFDKLINTANMNPGKPTIVYFGFANRNKGLETLIKSAPNIKANILLLTELDKNSEYQNMLVGLVEESTKSGASIYVSGYLDDDTVSAILHNSQLFVLSQQLPLTAKSSTAIAAAIHGVPIISKASQNPKYNLPYVDGSNSLLLETMDTESLSMACNKLLSSPDKMDKIKLESKKLANYFDWDSIASKHIETYDSVSK